MLATDLMEGMEAEWIKSLQSAFLDVFCASRKDGKWMKFCRPKKGRRVKSGNWWRRNKSERPWRPERRQEDIQFNGLAPRYSEDGDQC